MITFLGERLENLRYGIDACAVGFMQDDDRPWLSARDDAVIDYFSAMISPISRVNRPEHARHLKFGERAIYGTIRRTIWRTHVCRRTAGDRFDHVICPAELFFDIT